MTSFVLEMIGQFGYLGMFFSMILEAVIIIIPSELILATGGILASQKIFSFWGAFLIGLLGSIFCAVIIYAMGYFGGRPFVEKFGKYFFMKKEDIEKADDWFNRYGMLAAFIGRNFPIIRTFISLPAGILRARKRIFFTLTFLGSLVWSYLLVYVGVKFGQNMEMFKHLWHKFDILIVVVVGILGILYIYKHVKHLKES